MAQGTTKLPSPKKIIRVQSAWTKGMQSRVLSARNDTNLLEKGAAILDNVVIMQQGGLRKRPCNKLSCPLEYDTLLGVVFLVDTLWAVTTNQINSIAFNKIDSSDPAIVVDITTNSDTNGDIRFVQDQNVLLFTPQWATIAVTKTGLVYNFTFNVFVFNSFPVTQRFPNEEFTPTFDPNIPIYIFFRGLGDNDSYIQAQVPQNYLAVGNIVGIFAPPGVVFAASIPVGTIISVNGLVIRTLDPVANNVLYSYLQGLVLYGSTPALANIKATVYAKDNLGAYIVWANVYCITATYDQPIYQNNSFGKDMGTLPKDILPAQITNFQNRLITGIVPAYDPDQLNGINANNTSVWCSAAGNKFSYLQTTTDDDAPFSVTLSGNPTPQILNIYADDYLYVFADSGVYAFVNTLNTTFTPLNISLKRIGTHRCNFTTPVNHDGKVFYVQENGKAILSLAPANEIIDIDRTILCPTFIKNVTYLTSVDYLNTVDDKASDNSAYLLALGENVDQATGESSGTCILSYQYNAAQDLDGWTRWTFDGEKKPTSIFSCKNRLFAAFDDDNLYEFVLGKYVDDSADTVDSDLVPPLIKIQSNDFAMRDLISGDLLFKRKKYGHIYVSYVNTLTYKLNDETRNVGSLFNELEPSPKTGIDEVYQRGTYDIIQYITITQQHPSDLQLLATSVGLEVQP